MNFFIKYCLPFLMVYIWSTGFILATLVGPNADPNIFLSSRLGSCMIVFWILGVLLRKKMKMSWRDFVISFVIGMLVHGFYLSGVFIIIKDGYSAGVAALVGSMQPPLTALLAAKFDQEKHSRYLKLGLLLGVLGVFLAVSPMLFYSRELNIASHAILINVLAIFSLTIGIYLQKKFILNNQFFSNNTIQYAGGFVVALSFVILFNESYVVYNAEYIYALFHGIVVISLVGFSILLYLIKTGNVTKVTSLFFLVPPLTAIQAFLIFDQTLSAIQILGFAVALLGVYLTNKKQHRIF